MTNVSRHHVMIWHCIYAYGKVYARRNWFSSRTWEKNPIIDRDKDGTREKMRYRALHRQKPYLFEIESIPIKFMQMLKERESRNGMKPVEFTYGTYDDVDAIAIVTPPDTYSRKVGRNIVVSRLMWGHRTRKTRNFLAYS